jgi:WD40-like Beta Propeller Repeat
MNSVMRAARGLAVLLSVGCGESEPPAFSYFDQRVAPVLQVGCAQQTTGCHVATTKGTASGNLDLSSYDALLQREDVLAGSGPYAVGQLLLKGGDPLQIPVQTFDPPDPAQPDRFFALVTTDVRHAGGRSLREGSDGYARLKQWIAQGYAPDGAPRENVRSSEGDCRGGAGTHRGFDADVAPADALAYDAFVRNVQPVLRNRCAGGNCHGNPVADLYLSCGDNEAELRWNYFVARAHVDPSVSLSELLRRPLAKQRGGTFHEGGTVFLSTDDPGYTAVRGWIEGMASRGVETLRYQPSDEGLRFFGNYVQPMLVKKGCMFGNCHAPSMFHDLRLRGGSLGVFSRIAIDRNYEMAKLLLNTASADADDSRIVAKNLFPPERGGRGLAHRGSALLEDFAAPATPEVCAGVDVTAQPLDSASAYCVLVAWHALERKLAVQRGEVSDDPELALLYVSRPRGVGDVRDFDTYRPGADLLRAPLRLQGNAAPTLGTGVSLRAGCGLTASADIRGPAASWDGKRIAFAARSSAAEPLRLYEANADGTGCARLANLPDAPASANGILIHDLDPAYAPDGRIVFASTRGNSLLGGGPTRTPSQLAPNANLFVFDPRDGSVRDLTFLSNQELQPSFMADGRLIFTAEKRGPQFFQLAGRRQNLDGGDFHPLFAQRKSVGFEQATEIVELADRNLALVASKFGAADGAGTIAIVNRSIGPDQNDRDPNDKLYLHSLRFPAPGAFDGQSGAYRSPATLPSRWLVVSCDLNARDLNAGNFDFDLCAFDPVTGAVSAIGGVAGSAEVEATAIYARDDHGVFVSRHDEANARVDLVPGAKDAIVHVLDAPLLATLLFSNTRIGRPIDPLMGGLELLAPVLPGAARFEDLPAANVVSDDYGRAYLDYESLGGVLMRDDGSLKFRTQGGRAVVLRVVNRAGKPLDFAPGGPFEGEQLQREEIQFYPGERANQGFRRQLFDGMCGGCHGSVSGRELDVAVDIDALTHASKTLAGPTAPVAVGAP